jgi:hypothetical protein
MFRERTRHLQANGDHRGRNHSPRDGFSVQEMFVICLCLQSVTDGMSEVEDAPYSCLAFIFANHLCLDANALGDQPLQGFWLATKNAIAVRFHEREKIVAANHSSLE